MPRKKKKVKSEEPKPLNFDRAAEKGPSDRLDSPFMTPEDARGDNEDDQYYDTEEALSPEETKKRKEEGTF
jgi:hypothetical protein